MTVISSVCENNTLTLTLRIERGEFAKALDEAYMNDTEHYAVPGFAAGLAPREKIEELYGQTALFDEALDICVPRLYSRYLSENGIRTVGRPQLTAVTWLTGGGADFTVVCGVYPEVKLGEYKELEVNAKRDDEEAFPAAVLTAACTNMQAEVPESMVKQKLEAILAGDKMRVAQDPIYNVLADFTAILDEAYKQSDVTRSRAQVQAEALDVMLQTVSGDNREVSPAKLHELIRELVEHYRIVPRSFDEMLENIISERGTKKRAMTDDEKINDAFAAYLGTINQTEEMWRKDNTKRAEDAARFEIMQKVGMTKKEIRRSINSQLLLVFFAPLLMAGLHLCFAFPFIYKLLILMSLRNFPLLLGTTGISFLVFALLYLLVYRGTSNAYFNIVRSPSRAED